jgi:hypothetical protein
MALEDMLIEVPKLSTNERLLLLEAISRSLREELAEPPAAGSAERLFGSIPGGEHLTDQDIDNIRDERLMKKYG